MNMQNTTRTQTRYKINYLCLYLGGALICVTLEHFLVNHYINGTGLPLVYDFNLGFVLFRKLILEDHIEGIHR